MYHLEHHLHVQDYQEEVGPAFFHLAMEQGWSFQLYHLRQVVALQLFVVVNPCPLERLVDTEKMKWALWVTVFQMILLEDC
jgi:hypothetical protein